MHIDKDRLDDALGHLRRDFDGDRVELVDMLEKVTDSVMTLFGLSGAGLLMINRDSVVHPVLATDHQGWKLEAAQETAGEGPCIDAVLYGDLVQCEDITCDARWPDLAKEMVDSDLGGVLGVPITLGGVTVGALNVYVDRPHAWDDSDIGALRSYGHFIERMLAGALLAERSDELVQQLQDALDTRVVIERAIGLLMGRHQTDAVSAFNMLRDRARPERRKVIDVARELLDDVRPESSAG